MPFKKPTSGAPARTTTTTSGLFIGRKVELREFRENILQPDSPAYNLLSISGNGGVGKSTLLDHMLQEAASAEFGWYCLWARVDDNQTTQEAAMRHFAGHFKALGYALPGFEQALQSYEQRLNQPGSAPRWMPDDMWQDLALLQQQLARQVAPELPQTEPNSALPEGLKDDLIMSGGGAVMSGTTVASQGGITQAGGKTDTMAYFDRSRSLNLNISLGDSAFGLDREDKARQNALLRELTAAFIRGLNALAGKGSA